MLKNQADYRFVCWTIEASSIATLVVLACYPVLAFRLGSMDPASGKLVIALLELAFVFASSAATRVEWVCPSAVSRRTGILLLGLLISLTLSTILSIRPAVSVVRTAEWLVHTLFALAVFNFFRLRTPFSRFVPFVVGLAFVWYFLAFQVDYLIALREPSTNWAAAMPGFINIRHLGHYLAFILPMLLYCLMEESGLSGYSKGFIFVLSCLAWMLIFESGGRAPILVVFASLAVLPFIVEPKRMVLRFGAFALLSALVGAVLSLLFLDIGFGLERIFGKFEAETLNAFSSHRLALWSATAIQVLEENPLLGFGPDCYTFLDLGFPARLQSLHPHNLYFQSLTDWGLVGSSLMLAFGLSLSVDIYKALRRGERRLSPLGLVLIWIVLMLLAYSMLSGVLYYPFPSMLFFFTLGLLLSTDELSGDGLVSRGTSPGSRLLVSVVLGFSLFALVAHALSLRSLEGDPPPSPGAFSVTWLQWFPSALVVPDARFVLDSWAENWRGLEGGARNDWYDWVDANARRIPLDPPSF